MYDPVAEMMQQEVEYESYVRSLTDNFSVIDLVNSDNTRIGGNSNA